MNVVVLAPHTDDETLACGGTIAKYVENKHDVYVYAFSSGTSNHSEFKSAVQKLGATPHPFSHFETRVFTDCRQKILDVMLEIKKQLAPNIVFIPASSDCHQDHQVIHEEGKRAFKHSSIYGYECPWNSYNFSNTAYVKLSPDHMTTKVIAMQEYSSQVNRIYFREENIISLARVRGMQANTEYAECFEVVRQFL